MPEICEHAWTPWQSGGPAFGQESRLCFNCSLYEWRTAEWARKFYVDAIRYTDESRTTIAFRARYGDGEWRDYTTTTPLTQRDTNPAVWAHELIQSNRAALEKETDT